jgi:hypothetical protein
MRPARGEVLHFSEDPTITHFVPHVAPTSQHSEPYVWAVGPERCPDHWFPRACPREVIAGSLEFSGIRPRNARR